MADRFAEPDLDPWWGADGPVWCEAINAATGVRCEKRHGHNGNHFGYTDDAVTTVRHWSSAASRDAGGADR